MDETTNHKPPTTNLLIMLISRTIIAIICFSISSLLLGPTHIQAKEQQVQPQTQAQQQQPQTQTQPQTVPLGRFSVRGAIVDADTKQPIEYASVAIYKLPDSLLVSGSMSNEQGRFFINSLGNGRYYIKSTFIGYEITTIAFEINGSSLTLNEPIMAKPSALSIGEVVVTGSLAEKQQNIEKRTINVSKSIGSVTGNVTDILKGQAGINIDNENNIYIRGNKNTLILMDGIPTTLSSLNSVPAANIQNIEVITNPSAKYDAEGTGGIINIVTKREGGTGFSGRALLNYNIDKTVNGGVNLHFSNGTWDIDFGYNGKYERYKTKSTLDRMLYSQNVSVEQKMNSEQKSISNMANLLVGYRPNKRDLFIFGVKSIFPKANNNQVINGVANGEPFLRMNDVSWNRTMFEGTFSYRHIFQKDKNELSFDASFSRNKGRRPAEYFINNELLQKSSGGGHPTNFAIQVDYLKTISNYGKIESGLKVTSKFNNFDYKFYNLNTTNGEWVLDPTFSNDLEYQEYVYSAYSMYSGKLCNSIDYKIGARIEYNTARLNQLSTSEKIFNSYWFPFPFVEAKYKLDALQSLSASINRRVTRPIFPQINPFISIIDQTTFETGNKNIMPETMDKAELNYSLIDNKHQLRINFFASSTKNFITQVSALIDNDKLMLTYVNGNRQNKIGADFDYNINIGKYISLNPTLSAFYTKSTGYFTPNEEPTSLAHGGPISLAHGDPISLASKGFAWTASLKILIKPDKKTDIQLFSNYNSPISLPQFRLNEVFYSDLSIKRSFLGNRFGASITLTDIFNSRKWKIESDNPIYKLHNFSKSQTRFVWFGITLNFNSYKPSKTQKNSESDSNNPIIKL